MTKHLDDLRRAVVNSLGDVIDAVDGETTAKHRLDEATRKRTRAERVHDKAVDALAIYAATLETPTPSTP